MATFPKKLHYSVPVKQHGVREVLRKSVQRRIREGYLGRMMSIKMVAIHSLNTEDEHKWE